MGSDDLSGWCTCTGGGDWHEPYCEIFKVVKQRDVPHHGSRVTAVARNGHGQAPTPDGYVHMNDAGNNWHTWTARCDQGVCIPASDLRPVPAHPDSVPTDPDPYCWACDHDTHRCHGCGEPLPHGKYVCEECSKL